MRRDVEHRGADDGGERGLGRLVTCQGPSSYKVHRKLRDLGGRAVERAERVLQGAERLQPAFVKRDRVAWVATHRHSPQGNEPYVFAYFFKYVLEIPKGATSVLLPTNDHIRVFAMTTTRRDYGETIAAGELYAPEILRQSPAPGPSRPGR